MVHHHMGRPTWDITTMNFLIDELDESLTTTCCLPSGHLEVRTSPFVISSCAVHKGQGPHDKACFAWPLRSPNLMQCDFYLREFLKDCVYVPPLPADRLDLKHMIGADVARISSDTLNKVWDELAC
ncbi:DUF4817 domain-containing protein [Trichonephila clavipes]|nr:DUF4817 domain-containing protein [Trichonephila clavipes]